MNGTDGTLCHRCDRPIEAGQERRYTVDQGSGAAPETVVHDGGCTPEVPIRRHP